MAVYCGWRIAQYGAWNMENGEPPGPNNSGGSLFRRCKVEPRLPPNSPSDGRKVASGGHKMPFPGLSFRGVGTND